MFIWVVIFFLVLVITGVSLVFVYEDEVKGLVIKELNKHLKTEVRIDPKNIDLTFISTFPKCAIEFKNLTAMESWQRKDKDTLAFVEKLQLKFSIKDIFEKKYDVKQISISDAWCALKQDKNGNVNYLIWDNTAAGRGSQDSLQFKLEDISIKNFRITYKNSVDKINTRFLINDLTFAGKFSESNYELTTSGKVFLNTFSVNKLNYLKEKNLKLDVALDVNNNSYVFKKAEIGLNEMLFNLNGDLLYKDSLQKLTLNYQAKNLDIEAILSLLPEKYKKNIADYKSTGEFFAKGKFQYANGTPVRINSQFGIKEASVEYVPKNAKLTNVNLNGELLLNGKESVLKWSDFHATLNGDKVNGNFLMKDFNDPYIEIKSDADINLQNLYAFWPIDTLEKLEGHLKFAGEIKGLLKDIRQNTFSDKLFLDLAIDAEKLNARFKKDANDISLESCRVIARERNIMVEKFRLLRGKSDLDLQGEIPGLFNYILDRNAPLQIRGKLYSNTIVMEDLLFGSGNSSASNEEEFNVPSNLNLILDADIKQFSFGKFSASAINGNFELKNQKAMVSDMQFKTMDGNAIVNLLADASGKELEVSLQAQLNSINVKQLFTQMNNFGQTTLQDKNINGLVNATIDFSGNWDKKLNPLYNSILANSDLAIDKGELNDFKPLESLARFVDLQELKRIRFSTLSSSIQIKKGVIKIPQTTIKNSVLNLDFNGTHSFNNDIDYHIRLLISELLAKKRKTDDEFGPVENDPDNRRSAFILMTGNVDNPIIKYDKTGLKQKIKEDIKQEKQNLKQLFKEEFGAFKKDTAKVKSGSKSDQKFELEKPGNNPPKKTLEVKKKDDEDDDF